VQVIVGYPTASSIETGRSCSVAEAVVMRR
jgi:hypothetical protein